MRCTPNWSSRQHADWRSTACSRSKSMETRWQMLLLFLLLCSSSAAALTSLIATSASTSPVDDGTDRSSLLDFKKGITRDPSGILGSWNQTTHHCDWEGVTCSHNKHHPLRVTVLDLSSRGLAGSVSPSIGNLTFLTTIFLMSNGFDGEIPPEIGRLRRLQQLNLSFNSFHGGIPLNLTHCSGLRTIDLNNNQLNGGIPAELGSLSKLDTLGLSDNNITGLIPASLGNLSALTRLAFASNLLEGGIPDELGLLSNLEMFLLSDNELAGTIPSSIFNLSVLYYLQAASNQLQGILPSDMGNTLPNLQYLLLAGNQFSGSIPASLTNASGLVYIDLPNNDLVGRVPSDLGRLQGLRYLNLNVNQLEAGDEGGWKFFSSLTNCSRLLQLHLAANVLGGLLPISIANLSTGLQQLAMQDNQIAGSIDPGIENLVGLAALALHNNNLRGSIPRGIGKLSRLQWLGLYNNRLTGEIPSSIGNLTQLNYLGMLNNSLEGPIPPSLGDLQQLNTLVLTNNNLNGTIPKEIVSISSLSYVFSLANNSLVGPLPPEIGRLSNLEALYVSGNQLTGEIPASISGCQILEYLSLDNNLFEGTIPQSLGSMKGLRNLDLSHNNLSGPIPESLENLNALGLLDLSFNHLEGEVPMRGAFGNASVLSLLGNDGLCGGIADLNLPGCAQRSTRRRDRSPELLKIVIPIVSTALCLVFLFFCIAYFRWRGKARKQNSSVNLLEDQYQRVSYEELAKATNGFSSANIIGSGSYGTVYKGTLGHDNTIVAVKVFNLQQQGASKSFIAECEALRSIRHRNLVKILTSCSSIDPKGDDFKALVFEFMPKGSLDDCLHAEGAAGDNRSSSLSLLQRLNIAIDVADALGYLHHDCQPPIVHCDLKPSNVLIDDDMSAHVGDFGLAKLIPEAVSRSLQDSIGSIGIKGSIGYLAPEYGAGGQVSTPGDVYSFGILLLEMITGKRPVDEKFKDGLSLHLLVETSFPDRIMEIADPRVLLQEEDGNIKDTMNEEQISECLNSMSRIGLLCSNQSPRERMNMRDVAAKLNGIRRVYVGAG